MVRQKEKTPKLQGIPYACAAGCMVNNHATVIGNTGGGLSTNNVPFLCV
ncbi:MAG: hypothetical protein IJB48_05915 [Clostridia bacterium]|nr:hypothetical protein [Clostridia bacterium]MBQ3554484.1 hypothetical protein [Clostridia bacterium]